MIITVLNKLDRDECTLIIIFRLINEDFLRISDLLSRAGPAETIGVYRDTRDALIRTSKVRAKTINCDSIETSAKSTCQVDICLLRETHPPSVSSRSISPNPRILIRTVSLGTTRRHFISLDLIAALTLHIFDHQVLSILLPL